MTIARLIVIGTAACIITFTGTAHCQRIDAGTRSGFDPVERAELHPIFLDRPSVDFFEGALMGNGNLGAVVTTRPDAVVIHFGHNGVWDIRTNTRNEVSSTTFTSVYEHVAAIPDTVDSLTADPGYRDFHDRFTPAEDTTSPQPIPCGSLILRFDPRDAELIGHYVHINSGFCEIDFIINGELAHLQLFADMTTDRFWGRMVDEAGNPTLAPFLDIAILPDPDMPSGLPAYETTIRGSLGMLGFRQVLPGSTSPAPGALSTTSDDRAFALKVWANGGFLPLDIPDGNTLAGEMNLSDDFVFCVQLDTGPADSVNLGILNMTAATNRGFVAAATESVNEWGAFWRQSGVALDDAVLERTWYQNMYLLRCAVAPDGICPGIYGNWRYRNIGTGPNSGYHFDHHTQQTFWAAFTSNHPELHLPYVDLLETHLQPIGTRQAEDYFALDGIAVPRSIMPTATFTPSNPLPEESWTISATPWAAQSLWWHFMYTMEIDYLRDRAMPVIRETVRFLADYMTTHGDRQAATGDDSPHIYPSIPPRTAALTPGLALSTDPLPDLTLTKFMFFAYLESCRILGVTDSEGDLPERIRNILDRFPIYPTADTPWGDVYVTVSGEDPEVLLDIPTSLMSVFPGEEHGLHSNEDIYRRAARTYLNIRSGNGSDLVMLGIIGARLGMLDIDSFVRRIEYCRLPNGACSQKSIQTIQRISADSDPYIENADDGILIENFSLPAVINESLIQSYTGTVRLFPNWPDDVDGEFRTLRTAGAFLFSARIEDGNVQWIEVISEAGAPLKMVSPWSNGATIVTENVPTPFSGTVIDIVTRPGEKITFLPPQ